MRVHELTCFGAASGEGNTALVIEGGPLGEAERMAFATARKQGACAFLAPCNESDDESGNEPGNEPRAAWTIDYYYPHTRSALCLHATLGAARVLFARQSSEAPIAVKTAMHGQHLTLTREGSGLFVGLARQAVPALDIADGLAAALFDGPGIEPASRPQLASVGSPKLLIEVRDRAALLALRPNLELIVRWGKASGVSGCYAWCRLGEGNYEGRNFNHPASGLEDSATGVAAGALTALLGHGLTLHQGAATGQSCIMRTRVAGNTILVGGAAQLIGAQQ